MKHFFTGLTFLILIHNAYGQIEKDSTIINYINDQKEFVGFNNLDELPESIKPYLTTIKDYMANNKMDLNDYWFWTSYVQEDSSSIYIPICHYDGFVFKKDLEEKNIEANKDRKERELITVINFNGNASGKDGNLEIDRSTNKVLSFRLWQ
ncbi:hypothetical protein KFE94_10575 [bacterium SCSIO 12643]|nr:hypothetical protein KFE94_10575 [bacterium SCSIO 12643]